MKAEIIFKLDHNNNSVIQITHQDRVDDIEQKLLGQFLKDATVHGIKIGPIGGSTKAGTTESYENYIIRVKDHSEPDLKLSIKDKFKVIIVMDHYTLKNEMVLRYFKSYDEIREHIQKILLDAYEVHESTQKITEYAKHLLYVYTRADLQNEGIGACGEGSINYEVCYMTLEELNDVNGTMASPYDDGNNPDYVYTYIHPITQKIIKSNSIQA